MNIVNQNRILVDSEHELFDKTGMFYKEFPSDYRQIRYFTMLIVQKAPSDIKEINLLEQQISEIIKNAVKHGNKKDSSKIIKIWYAFTSADAKLIVEDQGEGFQNLEEWNDFNSKRLECLATHDFEQIAEYVSYRTEKSDENDGGNALFAALEYWNQGVVYTDKRNCVAVKKVFTQKKLALEIA